MTPRLFQSIAWLPLGIFVVLQLYVHEYDGWGRWAAAPILLLPVILSAALVPVGIRLYRSTGETGASPRSMLIATALAATPVLWFVGRALFA